MDKELLQKLIGYLETASPELWRIASRQVEVQIWRQEFGLFIFGTVAAIALVGLCWSIYKRNWQENDWESNQFYEGVIMVGCIALIIAGVISAALYINLVSMQMNPDYYAILELMKLVK